MQCPLLKDGAFHLDYLGSEAINYAIVQRVHSDPVIRQYTDGEKIKQYSFSFMSIEQYSEQIQDQIEASGFYEELEKWIDEQDKIKNFPDIPGVIGIEAIAPGYLFDLTAVNMAKYEIQCRVIYSEY